MSTGLVEKEHWHWESGTLQPPEPEPALQERKSNKLVGQWIAKAEPSFADPHFFHLSFLLLYAQKQMRGGGRGRRRNGDVEKLGKK